MPLLPRLSNLWRNLFRKTRKEQELTEEIDVYLEMLVEQKINAGLDPAEARRAALIELGGKEQVKEQVREVRMGYHLETLWQDVRYAARSLRKHAMLSVVVVATLTLGIGVSAGVFTYFSAQFLRAHVDKDFASFAQVYTAYTNDRGRPPVMTLEDFLAFQDRAKSLRNMAAWADSYVPLGQEGPIEIRILLVTPNFFSLYDLEQPLLGRLLNAEDFASSSPVVVLSEQLWRDRFASDPQIVGKVAHFSGQPVTVVGVAPVFAGLINDAKAWLPYSLGTYLKRGDGLLRPGEVAWLNVAGRLNSGLSHRDAATELSLLASQQDRLHPGRKTTFTVTDGSGVQAPDFPDRLNWVVYLTIGALTIFVLIVCMNVTTMLLARAVNRRQEIAVRLAMGAGRLRLIRMLLAETFLLAALAGLASVYIAYHLPNILWLWIHDETRQIVPWSLAPDWRSFGYLTLVTLFAGMVAGLAPALQSLKINLSESLKGNHGMLGAPARGSRLYGLLIGAEVALSFLLLVFAFVTVRAYHKSLTLDPGFETRQVLYAHLERQSQPSERRPAWDGFHLELTARLKALPGVQSIAYASRPPFSNVITIDVQNPGQEIQSVAFSFVSPNYFTTLGIPIVVGRALQQGDPSCGRGVACPVVISQRLARKIWPNEDPLGKALREPRGQMFEVVGIARDVSFRSLGVVDDSMLYLPWRPNTRPYNAFVRFSGDEATLARAVRSNILDLAPEISAGAKTIQSQRDWIIADIERNGRIIVFLVAIAFILAVIGIYGMVSFVVTQRTREMGIRIALGAKGRDIYRAVLGSSMRPVVVGLLVGLAITLGAASAAAKAFGARPITLDFKEPLAYAMTAILLAMAALVAMLVPARRATRVDPMKVLREE
jgi:predicted permease